jgi:CTP-dependent riboflavin kinase
VRDPDRFCEIVATRRLRELLTLTDGDIVEMVIR